MATKPALHHVSGGGGGDGIGVGDVSLFAENGSCFCPNKCRTNVRARPKVAFSGREESDSAACIFVRLSTLCEALGSLNGVM